MNKMIVGGYWGTNPRPSSLVRKLCHCFDSFTVFNGEGESHDLPSLLDHDADLVLWMPDIDNEEKKFYPYKTQGQVLICSKVMRGGYSKLDAVSRIFAMHGNAVIAIYKKAEENGSKLFSFELIDALGNTWYEGTDINELAQTILKFYDFTKSAVRIGSKQEPNHRVELFPRSHEDEDRIEDLILANSKLKNNIMTQCGNRFFGNISTRCQNLFPTLRGNTGIFVSPRNTDKDYISWDEMLLCSLENGIVIVHNGRNVKPSVDAPVQIRLYEECPDIQFMIHGHAFCNGEDFPYPLGETENYRLCGDFREVDEILQARKLMGTPNNGIINLKNHGFLIFAENIDVLNDIIYKADWYMEFGRI